MEVKETKARTTSPLEAKKEVNPPKEEASRPRALASVSGIQDVAN